MPPGDLIPSFNGFLHAADDPERNLRGRVIFVHALILAPGFWQSLRDEVLFPGSDFHLAIARKEETSTESQQEVQKIFDQWLLAHGVVDAWLMDAAQHTIQAWAMILLHVGRNALDNCPRPWYSPTGAALTPALEEFRPEIDQPYPLPLKPLTPEEQRELATSPEGFRIYQAEVARESPLDFRKRIRKQFDAQLNAFVTRFETRMSEGRNMRRDAAWTALYQGGMSPKAIETWEWERSKTDHTVTRIQQAIHEFAEAIGLTLRSPRGGSKVKGTKVPRAKNLSKM